MRRVYLNIGVFAVLTTLLIAWSAATLFPIDAIDRPYRVTARFEESPGLRSGYEVTYLGHAIGSIDSVALGDGASELVLAIDRGVEVPAAVDAAARRRSAIGEPYVDLYPSPGTDDAEGPRLAEGDVIPVERTTSPIQYGELFRSLDVLVRAIDPEAVATVVDELALAVDGRGDDIRRLVLSGRDLATSAVDNGDEIEALVADLGRIASVAATHRNAIGSTIDDLAALTATLDSARPSAEALLDSAPSSIGLLNRILDASDASLVCVLDGLSVVDVALDGPTLESLAAVLQRSKATSDVIASVVDDRDGYVRLYMQFTGAVPAVVYAERLPLPPVPSIPDCPARAFAPDLAGVAGDATSGRGGSAAGDGDGLDDPGGRPGDGDDPATGDSDLASDDDPLVLRAIRTALPWLLVLLLVAAGAYALWRMLRDDGPGDEDGAMPDPIEPPEPTDPTEVGVDA